jgi:hypothetical protein
MRASVVVAWHFGHDGLRNLGMMVALDQAGALQNSRSPVVAVRGR